MLFTPDFDFQAAGLTILDQIELFLICTFDTFLSHESSPLPNLFGVSVHRAIEWFDSRHAMNAKTGKWGDASPVKEIIAQISRLVKTLDYSLLTLHRKKRIIWRNCISRTPLQVLWHRMGNRNPETWFKNIGVLLSCKPACKGRKDIKDSKRIFCVFFGLGFIRKLAFFAF
jgi:hypothetical protein